jgi:hypothetical protein
MSESITQIVIFHPGVPAGGLPKRTRGGLEQTADRQQHINQELERIQIEDNGVVRQVVLGTNNFVYAVIDYPVDDMSESNRNKALAADIEDVLLRFRGNPDDAETLRRVTEDLLA